MSDSNPLVSVVIPCFNAARTVADAIQSVLGQEYQNREIIVIDDGSTDGSLEVIRTFGDRVRWETGPNRGGNVARNRGIELARGELIQFLDADDILYPNRLSVMVPVALAEGPQVLVASGWDLLSEDQVTLQSRPLNYTTGDPLIWLLDHDLQTSAPLHWKSVLNSAGGFNPELKRCQEFDLHLRIFRSKISLHAVGHCLYRFRRQPNSVSANLSRILIGRCSIQEVIASSLQIDETERPRRIALARQIAVDARKLVRLGCEMEAGDAFQRAEKIFSGAVRSAFPEAYLTPVRWISGPIIAEKAAMWIRRFTMKGLRISVA